VASLARPAVLDAGVLKSFGRASAVPTFSLIDPLTPSGVQPDGQTSGWQLAFSDEFAGGSLDREKWDPWYPDTDFWNKTSPGGHLTNSNEPQAYDPSALSFDGSAMSMTLRNQSTVAGIPYTSGMITSYPSFNTTYGYFEARMQLPRVNGAWPAFWMDRTDQTWPPEIDWMEAWGTAGIVGQNYHSNGQGSFGSGQGSTPTNAGYNTFGGLWEPGHIRWFVNGVQVYDLVHASVNNAPMYMICNLAGDKDNVPATSVLPFSAKVDYIRAWKAAA